MTQDQTRPFPDPPTRLRSPYLTLQMRIFKTLVFYVHAPSKSVRSTRGHHNDAVCPIGSRAHSSLYSELAFAIKKMETKAIPVRSHM